MGAEFTISNQCMVPRIITALGSKCAVPQFTHTGSCGDFSARLLFWPNHNCDIPKELGEPHTLSAEIIFLREIVNISSRQWNHRTTSPPGAGAAVGAGKVVLQYQLQSQISNLEIRFFFFFRILWYKYIQALSCKLSNLKGGVQLDSWNTTKKSSIHQIKCTFQ